MRQTTDRGRVPRFGRRTARVAPGWSVVAMALGAWLAAGTVTVRAEGSGRTMASSVAETGGVSAGDGKKGQVRASAASAVGLITPAVTRGVAVAGDSAALRPKLRGDIPTPVRRKLSAAFAVALGRVRSVQSCAGLFEDLGADGVGTLAFARYYAAAWNSVKAGCRSRVAAFTGVGSPHTRLCGGFASLSTEGAAVILIHEALHTAGLTERPSDPDGLTSQEINWMVKKSCGL